MNPTGRSSLFVFVIRRPQSLASELRQALPASLPHAPNGRLAQDTCYPIRLPERISQATYFRQEGRSPEKDPADGPSSLVG
jgi:hypothetical protein